MTVTWHCWKSLPSPHPDTKMIRAWHIRQLVQLAFRVLDERIPTCCVCLDISCGHCLWFVHGESAMSQLTFSQQPCSWTVRHTIFCCISEPDRGKATSLHSSRSTWRVPKGACFVFHMLLHLSKLKCLLFGACPWIAGSISPGYFEDLTHGVFFACAKQPHHVLLQVCALQQPRGWRCAVHDSCFSGKTSTNLDHQWRLPYGMRFQDRGPVLWVHRSNFYSNPVPEESMQILIAWTFQTIPKQTARQDGTSNGQSMSIQSSYANWTNIQIWPVHCVVTSQAIYRFQEQHGRPFSRASTCFRQSTIDESTQSTVNSCAIWIDLAVPVAFALLLGEMETYYLSKIWTKADNGIIYIVLK